MRSIIVACAATAVLLLAGCEPAIYRAETVLHSDGSIDRAIYQPASETPVAALEAGIWTGSTRAARIRHESWTGRIADLPPADPDKSRPYFAAWGHFGSSEALPKTFLVEGPEGFPDGTLTVQIARDDWGLITEFTWDETLNDIVTLDDMHQARRELANLLIPVAEKILHRGLGEHYDTSGVVDWLHGPFSSLVFELSDAYFDHASRRDGSENELAPYAKIMSRHGIVLPDVTGRLPGQDDMQPMVAAYVRKSLRETLRRCDGQPADEPVIDEIIFWLGVEPLPDGVDRSSRLDSAAKDVIREMFGNDEAFGEAVKPLLQRILGLYRASLADTRRFVYTLEMPGPIIETTGELVTDRVTRWKFADADAYPAGYRMRCRALAVDGALVEKLTGGAGLDRQKQARYLDLVRENPALLAVMRMCATDGSLYRLRRERDALAEAEDELAASYTAMLELLGAAGN